MVATWKKAVYRGIWTNSRQYGVLIAVERRNQRREDCERTAYTVQGKVRDRAHLAG